MPNHDLIEGAVARSADAQLQQLFGGPDSYFVRGRDEIGGLARHRVHEIFFSETDHPMSFVLATDGDTGDAAVLSGRIAAMHTFLAGEPALRDSDGLAATFHELFRPRNVHSRVLEAPAPTVDRRGATITISYVVFIEGERERWTVFLPSEGGQPSIRMVPIDDVRHEVHP